MLDRFTDCARKVMGQSRKNAIEYPGDACQIEAEHILFALYQIESVAQKELLSAGLTDEAFFGKLPTSDPELPRHWAVPFTKTAKRALEAAADIARGLGSKEINTRYLLLGVMTTDAAAILVDAGIDTSALVETLHNNALKPTELTHRIEFKYHSPAYDVDGLKIGVTENLKLRYDSGEWVFTGGTDNYCEGRAKTKNAALLAWLQKRILG